MRVGQEDVANVKPMRNKLRSAILAGTAMLSALALVTSTVQAAPASAKSDVQPNPLEQIVRDYVGLVDALANMGMLPAKIQEKARLVVNSAGTNPARFESANRDFYALYQAEISMNVPLQDAVEALPEFKALWGDILDVTELSTAEVLGSGSPARTTGPAPALAKAALVVDDHYNEQECSDCVTKLIVCIVACLIGCAFFGPISGACIGPGFAICLAEYLVCKQFHCEQQGPPGDAHAPPPSTQLWASDGGMIRADSVAGLGARPATA